MSHNGSTKIGAAKFGALGFAAVALGCAALAAIMVGRMLTARGYTGSRVVPVVVAKSALAAARPLSPDDLELRDWPEDAVPAGAFTTVEDVFAGGVRPSPTAGILAGEPVVASRLASKHNGTAIASMVQPNMRAVAIQVDDSVGYTGLVYPGVHVDVIATIRDPAGRGPSARIAVQNARVLTVGAETDVATRRAGAARGDLTRGPDEHKTFVTLEVTPEEAEIISIARNEGNIDIALRNGSDDVVVETGGATPNKFSAFAVDEEGQEVASDDSSRDRRRIKPRSVKQRRIQVIAHDERDAKEPQKIETYHAR